MKLLILLFALICASLTNAQDEYLDFGVQTVTYNGEYTPENCGVIWIETAEGQFVRTLKVWANKRINRLVKWQAVSFGNVTDAITSATIKTHEFHQVQWNMKDYNSNLVENGDYNIIVEYTEDDSNKPQHEIGKFIIVPFTKTGNTEDFEIEDDEFFADMTISYHAEVNSVDNNAVNVHAFPNPFSDIVNIQIQSQGISDIQVSLINSLGEKIKNFSSINNEQDIYQFNIEGQDLATGVYYCIIKAGNNVTTHKIIKI